MHKVSNKRQPRNNVLGRRIAPPKLTEHMVQFSYAISHHPDQGWRLIEARKG
jgi:hypothetical protein